MQDGTAIVACFKWRSMDKRLSKREKIKWNDCTGNRNERSPNDNRKEMTSRNWTFGRYNTYCAPGWPACLFSQCMEPATDHVIKSSRWNQHLHVFVSHVMACVRCFVGEWPVSFLTVVEAWTPLIYNESPRSLYVRKHQTTGGQAATSGSTVQLIMDAREINLCSVDEAGEKMHIVANRT